MELGGSPRFCFTLKLTVSNLVIVVSSSFFVVVVCLSRLCCQRQLDHDLVGVPVYANGAPYVALHTTSAITHSGPSTLPQPSRTTPPPHYLIYHSQQALHTTSTIVHGKPSTLPQPSLTSLPPHYFNRHPQLHTTSTITHSLISTLPQPSLTS